MTELLGLGSTSITIDLVGSNALVVVIHTYVEQNGEEIVRIISARKATKGERARYEEGT